jgi:hypothetical protein
MERTKQNQKLPFEYNQNEEPIVFSKHLMDILLSQPDYAEIFALYGFYYYTAKWQKTNQPKATSTYVQNGLNWGKHKVQSIKRRLKELKLIEDIQYYNKEKQITEHYIKVMFIWSKHPLPENRVGTPLPDFSTGTKTGTLNALSSNININALSSNKSFLNAREEENSSSKERNTIPPTLKMIETYCSNKNSPIDPETFFNFYESKGWFIGKNKMKDWHCAIATWEKKDKKESNYVPNRSYGNDKSKPKYAAARTSKLKSIPDIIINNTTNEWKKTI